MECLGLHNKPKTEVHPGHKLTVPKKKKKKKKQKRRRRRKKKKGNKKKKKKKKAEVTSLSFGVFRNSVNCALIIDPT
jgi:hypothetical protein